MSNIDMSNIDIEFLKIYNLILGFQMKLVTNLIHRKDGSQGDLLFYFQIYLTNILVIFVHFTAKL